MTRFFWLCRGEENKRDDPKYLGAQFRRLDKFGRLAAALWPRKWRLPSLIVYPSSEMQWSLRVTQWRSGVQYAV